MIKSRSTSNRSTAAVVAARSSATHAVSNSETLRALLDEQWAELRPPFSGDATGAQIDARLDRLAQLHEAVVDSLASQAEHDGRLADALERLEAFHTTADIVATVPRLVCDLGFDRAIMSSIEHGVWRAESVFVPGEPAWAAAIRAAGRDNPQALGPTLHETEMVRRREGMVVTDAQNDNRVNKPIAMASMSQSYVAAPILSDGRVVGLLHADKYRRRTEVATDDCRLLLAFSHGVRLALSRARLAEQLASTRSRLQSLSEAIDLTITNPGRLDLTAGSQAGGPDAAATARRTTATVTTRVERAGLTSREREVLELIARGLGNSAIGAELVIAEGTVKQHVKHVLRKLHANNRSEATAIYFAEVAGRP